MTTILTSLAIKEKKVESKQFSGPFRIVISIVNWELENGYRETEIILSF